MSEREVVVFDLETTGKDTEIDRIVQIAAVKFNADFEEIDHYVKLINPGVPISPGAAAVHGYHDEDVEDAPRFKEIAAEVLAFIDNCDLAGHNMIAFDLPILNHELQRCGLETFELAGRHLYDTCQLFRVHLPHTLASALRHYCDEEIEGAHDALNDSRASAKVLQAQFKRHGLAPETAAQLSMGNRVTLDGKLVRNDEGAVCLAFGKFTGKTLEQVVLGDPGFLRWMLKKDFSKETKDVVRKALKGK